MKLNERELANTRKLVTSNGISKLGDILFDYVNSVWLSKLGNGSFWMAVYQSSETIVSVFVNFIGGILSDTKQRKNIIWICDIIANCNNKLNTCQQHLVDLTGIDSRTAFIDVSAQNALVCTNTTSLGIALYLFWEVDALNVHKDKVNVVVQSLGRPDLILWKGAFG